MEAGEEHPSNHTSASGHANGTNIEPDAIVPFEGRLDAADPPPEHGPGLNFRRSCGNSRGARVAPQPRCTGPNFPGTVRVSFAGRCLTSASISSRAPPASHPVGDMRANARDVL